MWIFTAVHAYGGPQRMLGFLLHPSPYFLRQGLLLTLELGRQPAGPPVVLLPFLECWGYRRVYGSPRLFNSVLGPELRFSSMHTKLSFPLSPPTSPMPLNFAHIWRCGLREELAMLLG